MPPAHFARPTAPRRARWLLALLFTLAPVYASAAEIVHVVGKGQTLGRIAKRYRVSVDALRDANGLRAGARIHPGLELVIPEKEGAGKKGGEPTSARKGKADKPLERAGKRGARGKEKEEEETGEPATFRGRGRRGFVRLLRGTEKLEVQTLTRHGHLAPVALTGFGKMLRFYPTGAKIPIDPRLAALVGQVSDHFGGRPLHVISGFRPYTPAQYTPHSNHNVGRAMDFSVEGIPNTVVRDFCRSFRNAGVGYYPNSTFVHLDVRAAKAYWIDYSRPGEAPHYDSPGGQRSADESAGDVEGRSTPADAPAPAPGGDPGSPATPRPDPPTP
jgi:uncharacterized protein YcbK (DUF882 family)